MYLLLAKIISLFIHFIDWYARFHELECIVWRGIGFVWFFLIVTLFHDD